MTKAILFVGMLSASSALLGCGDTEDPQENPIVEQGELEIQGTWESNFGGTEIISGDSWATESEDFSSAVRIDAYSNEENEVITQNPDDAEYFPSRYSRVVYTDIDDDSFYYCITDFDVATSADARARNTVADDSDPENGGCGSGGFAWTLLTRD
jgi:hypothetical protein